MSKYVQKFDDMMERNLRKTNTQNPQPSETNPNYKEIIEVNNFIGGNSGEVNLNFNFETKEKSNISNYFNTEENTNNAFPNNKNNFNNKTYGNNNNNDDDIFDNPEFLNINKCNNTPF